MTRRPPMHSGLILSGLLLSLGLGALGCQGRGITLGPVVETRWVIVRPGRPIEILSTQSVTGRRLEDDAVGRVDITGWIAMPREHFEVMAAAIEGGD